MTAERGLRSLIVVIILALMLASTGSARAWSGCYGYITVQPGDTLAGIAAACSTTVDAIRAANPTLGSSLDGVAGIYMPTGGVALTPSPAVVLTGGTTYTAQAGDTLGGVAMLYGVAVSDILALNPGLTNTSALTAGEVINVPANPTANYYLPNPYQATFNPAPTADTGLRNLMVTFGRGLLVRSGPGINFPEIKSPWVSAVKFSHWQYRKNSLTIDNIGFVWVEVRLSPLVVGRSTGWILVRDSLGKYFTSPNLGPKIDLNDP